MLHLKNTTMETRRRVAGSCAAEWNATSAMVTTVRTLGTRAHGAQSERAHERPTSPREALSTSEPDRTDQESGPTRLRIRRMRRDRRCAGACRFGSARGREALRHCCVRVRRRLARLFCERFRRSREGRPRMPRTARRSVRARLHRQKRLEVLTVPVICAPAQSVPPSGRAQRRTRPRVRPASRNC